MPTLYQNGSPQSLDLNSRYVAAIELQELIHPG
jgi:hypothetical protein